MGKVKNLGLGWPCRCLVRFLSKTANCGALMAHTLAEPRDLYEFKDSVIYPENSRIVRTVLQKTLFQIIFKKGVKEE